MSENVIEDTPPKITPRHSWRLSETRQLTPFPQEHGALDNVAFSFRGDEEPNAANQNIYIPDDIGVGDISPKFKLSVDRDMLKRSVHIVSSEALLNITVRDHNNKNYRLIQRWSLNDAPEEYAFDNSDLSGLSLLQRLTFCVVVSVPEELPRKFRSAHYKGSILAEKHFSVRREPESLSFPIEPASPSFFESIGMPGETLWAVDVGSEVDEPPEAAVHVYLNEDAVKKLNKAFGGNVAGGLLKNQIMSEIYFEICCRVLNTKTSSAVEEGSVLEAVVQSLEQFGELKELQAAAKDGGARLRSFVQAHLKLTRKIQSADLRKSRTR